MLAEDKSRNFFARLPIQPFSVTKIIRSVGRVPALRNRLRCYFYRFEF